MSKTFRLVTTIIIVVLAFFTVLFTGMGLRAWAFLLPDRPIVPTKWDYRA